jgi:uncharacterized protein (DUF58 family)
MISSDAVKKIRKIQIIASRTANDLFAGRYRSAFRGRGLEFGELREYEAGDDIRFIDWNVTARTGRLHIKKFTEERELTVLFLVDVSASGRFGTVHRLKDSLAAEICALLSFTALKNNDKIGLVLFSDRIEKFVPPKKGSRQALRVIRDALYFQPEGKGTDIALALEYVGRVFKRRMIIFLISDLYSEGFEKPLAVMARRHDIMVMVMNDPAEVDLPDAGLLRLQDAESGERFLIDSADPRVRDGYGRQNRTRLDDRKRRLRSLRVDAVDIFTGIPYLRTLIAFFKMREKKLRNGA